MKILIIILFTTINSFAQSNLTELKQRYYEATGKQIDTTGNYEHAQKTKAINTKYLSDIAKIENEYEIAVKTKNIRKQIDCYKVILYLKDMWTESLLNN